MNKTRDAVTELPDGDLFYFEESDGLIYTYGGCDHYEAGITGADLKQLILAIEAERDQYKHLAEGRGKLLILRELRDGACDLSDEDLAKAGVSRKEADIARAALKEKA